MTNRYFLPDLPAEGGIIDLPRSEAAHANRVMRVKLGDELILFDGKNHQSKAVVIGQTKRDCQCEFEQSKTVNREPNIDVTIGLAMPRGDRSKSLVERLTEIGVRTIVPLHAERSQGKPNHGISSKLLRIAIESCKQCGRNQLPTISETISSQAFFQERSNQTRFIAHPNSHASSTNQQPGTSQTGFRLAIGPEGGFTDREVHLAVEHGFTPIGLGPRIYRIETAAIVIATLMIHDKPNTIDS